MKRLRKLIVATAAAVALPSFVFGSDMVDLLAYSKSDGVGGMKFAVRNSANEKWHSVASGYTFLGSDYGAWGSGKKMYNVKFAVDTLDNSWHVVFNPDQKGTVVAHASTPDMVHWMPQAYRRTSEASEIVPTSLRYGDFTTQVVNGDTVKGSVVKVSAEFVNNLDGYAHYLSALSAKHGELTDQDPWRFEGLKPLTANVTLQPNKSKEITDKFIGIFFEDINYGADGGLYAELVQNRDFEYVKGEGGHDKEWGPTKAWSVVNGKGDATLSIDTVAPIHVNNANYAVFNVTRQGAALQNSGFDGIAVKEGEELNFSLRARAAKSVAVTVRLVDADGKVIAQGKVKVPASKQWATLDAKLKATATCDKAKLQLVPSSTGTINLDMVSLFPKNTFHGQPNGLRNDLATVLADLHPRFMRFPGGCVAHGNGVDNIYDWKGSIGPLEARRPLSNLWGYHQTRGLGYYEYFIFCENIGAEPLPVLAAGVPCQNSSHAAHHSVDDITTAGQQCGVPMEEMDAYIQDVLDLIEYANGDVTTTWGARRAEAGHPAPFNLKYIGIGNEDLISDVFKERFKMINDAVRKAHPEITVVGTVGPFYEGADYEEGWRFALQENVPIVDEHYYVEPGWYIHNRDYYDNYKRNSTKVYLGEYASHYPGRISNLEAALSIALYLTDVERNGDVVEMTSYAPLLAKKGHTQWVPDMIYFDNTSIQLTPDYYVQKLYGQNPGTTYIPSEITLSNDSEDVNKRFGVSTVVDEKTGDTIVRIANMLPVEITTNLSGYPTGAAVLSTLAGSPRATDVAPQVKELQFNGKLTVPAYSFSVLRIKK
jgi:alpha-L-arabinofuranosidase